VRSLFPQPRTDSETAITRSQRTRTIIDYQ
jgi:hypothetical protein